MLSVISKFLPEPKLSSIYLINFTPNTSDSIKNLYKKSFVYLSQLIYDLWSFARSSDFLYISTELLTSLDTVMYFIFEWLFKSIIIFEIVIYIIVYMNTKIQSSCVYLNHVLWNFKCTIRGYSWGTVDCDMKISRETLYKLIGRDFI